MLEIFAALFRGIQPDSLQRVDTRSPSSTALADRSAQMRSRQPGDPAPRHAAKKPGQRHPRFGGVFTRVLDDGVKQCSMAGARQSDLLGPVGAAAKAKHKKVRQAMHAQLWLPASAQPSSVHTEASDAWCRVLRHANNLEVACDAMQGPRRAAAPAWTLKCAPSQGYVERFLQSSYNILMTGPAEGS